MEQRDETFRFTYSAVQQAEVEKIRKKYIRVEEDKLEQLRRLDRSVHKKGKIWSIVLGTIGALIMGAGMSLVMTNLGEVFGSHADLAMPIGIIVGLAGMVLVALAYPVYNRIVKKERERIAPEILRLTDELMQ